MIRAAIESGKNIDVYADETRPFLQGARLTVWELQHDGIQATLITDNMAGHFLRKGQIGCVVVGADRIAANGDVANKIGTYSVAVLAKENNVPFYVAAPLSTLDLTLESGDLIPIEERGASEVTHVFGVPVAPAGTSVRNPAFDVTPNRYVTAIITEKGVARSPFRRLAAPTGGGKIDENDSDRTGNGTRACGRGRLLQSPRTRLLTRRFALSAARPAGLSGQSASCRHHVHTVPRSASGWRMCWYR